MPTTQRVQLVLTMEEAFPVHARGQSLQADFSERSWNINVLHAVHSVKLVASVVKPAGQCTHEIKPVACPKRPLSHVLHAADCAAA